MNCILASTTLVNIALIGIFGILLKQRVFTIKNVYYHKRIQKIMKMVNVLYLHIAILN